MQSESLMNGEFLKENNRLYKENCELKLLNSKIISKLNEFRFSVEKLSREISEIPTEHNKSSTKHLDSNLSAKLKDVRCMVEDLLREISEVPHDHKSIKVEVSIKGMNNMIFLSGGGYLLIRAAHFPHLGCGK